MQAILTDHSIQRARERLKWNRKTLQRMADRAIFYGFAAHDTKGELRAFLESKNKAFGDHTKLHGEIIFVFSDIYLLTVLNLPNEYKKAAAKLEPLHKAS